VAIEECIDRAGLAAWAALVEALHPRRGPLAGTLVESHTAVGFGPGQPLRHFLARLGGRPVSAAVGFLGAGVVGLYWVGTLPEARRRGLGAAVSLAPLLAARAAGVRVGILHASSMGVPVYQRLGFRQHGPLDIWAPPT
jgi:GNAT superfamily N-acetyltransferase